MVNDAEIETRRGAELRAGQSGQHNARDNTTIVSGAGNSAAFKARANELRLQIQETKSAFDRERLYERLATLVSDVACQ